MTSAPGHNPTKKHLHKLSLFSTSGALVQWLWEETDVPKVVGSNKGRKFFFAIFIFKDSDWLKKLNILSECLKNKKKQRKFILNLISLQDYAHHQHPFSLFNSFPDRSCDNEQHWDRSPGIHGRRSTNQDFRRGCSRCSCRSRFSNVQGETWIKYINNSVASQNTAINQFGIS